MTITSFDEAKNILCVRLDQLGDVLMTTPAIRALKENRPDRRVTLLTSRSGAGIARLVPEIDEVLIYDAPWMKSTPPRPDSQPDYAMIELLRAKKFDAAVIFTVYSQNPVPAAFLCYMAGIPLRLAHCHENVYQLLTHWVLDSEPAQTIHHEVRRQLDLVATAGAQTSDERMSLQAPAEALERVTSLLNEIGLDQNRPWLVIHPGATAPSRRYPPERFGETARQLAAEDGWQIVLTGTGEEGALVETIQPYLAGYPVFSLVDQLSLAEMVALLKMAPMLLANNTGPVHMAAALGTPVVDLYALTNPQHTPWAIPHRTLSHDVPCKYCYKSICPQVHNNCLRLITPAEVVAAVRELWQEIYAQSALTASVASSEVL